MMARANYNLLFDNQLSSCFSFVSMWCFLKDIENMFFVFLSSYRSVRESLGELEKSVETLARGSCSHSRSRSPKFPLVFPFKQLTTSFYGL